MTTITGVERRPDGTIIGVDQVLGNDLAIVMRRIKFLVWQPLFGIRNPQSDNKEVIEVPECFAPERDLVQRLEDAYQRWKDDKRYHPNGQ